MDVSRKSISRLDGYPSYAEFISKDRDAAIYRRFGNLNARSLLYMQSELHELERQLEDLDKEDLKDISNEDAQKAARMWESFSGDQSEAAYARRLLQCKVRGKVKEYYEALMLESQILSLNSPSSETLKTLRKWFHSTSTPILWGRDEHLIGNEHEHDLVALAPVDTDRLNVFLKSYFGWFFREQQHGDIENNGLYYFSEKRVQHAGVVISTCFCAILLIGAIVCLLSISDRGIGLRVGMIVLFTCLFAGVVGLLTNARRAEIFGATAAYTAVLVVFVSNNLQES